MVFSYHFFSSGFSHLKLLPTVTPSKTGTVIPVSFPTLPFKPIAPNHKSNYSRSYIIYSVKSHIIFKSFLIKIYTFFHVN